MDSWRQRSYKVLCGRIVYCARLLRLLTLVVFDNCRMCLCPEPMPCQTLHPVVFLKNFSRARFSKGCEMDNGLQYPVDGMYLCSCIVSNLSGRSIEGKVEGWFITWFEGECPRIGFVSRRDQCCSWYLDVHTSPHSTLPHWPENKEEDWCYVDLQSWVLVSIAYLRMVWPSTYIIASSLSAVYAFRSW